MYSEVMTKKVFRELKDIGDSEEGGFSAGKHWKFKKKNYPQGLLNPQQPC